MSVIQVLFLVCFPLCYAENENTKRLLLNDMDAMTRLTNLERNVQQLTGDLAQEKLVVSTLQADLTQEKLSVSKLRADLNKEKLTVSKLQEELTNEKSKVLKLQQSNKDYGSTYIRWGRTQCSGLHTELIYTGFAAGNPYSYISTRGGPANMLCLPNNPELSNITGPGSSVLFGTEFENGDFFGNAAQDEDVPCSLCRSKNTSTSVMIPGRRTCYNGWKLEYNGVLASGSYADRPSSYICVDSHPEFLQAGDDDKNGHLLYGTTTKCGSLPCPPYGKDLKLNCVVCSK